MRIKNRGHISCIAKRVGTLLILLCWCGATFAQEKKATANAMATIITPVILIKEDINFSKTAVSSPRTLVIPNNSTFAQQTIVDAGGLKAAAFTIISEPLYLYNISLPSTPLTVNSGSYTITLNRFTNNASSNEAVASQGSGNQTLYVSAKLFNRSSMADGTAASPTPFDVTVNYN